MALSLSKNLTCDILLEVWNPCRSLCVKVTITFLYILPFQMTSAYYTMSLILTEYNNSENKLLNGSYCHGYADRSHSCNHQFHVCLDEASGFPNNHTQCAVNGPVVLPLNSEHPVTVIQHWQVGESGAS